MTSAEIYIEKEYKNRSKRYLWYSIFSAVFIALIIIVYFIGNLENRSWLWPIPFLEARLILSPVCFIFSSLIVYQTIKLRKVIKDKKNLTAIIISFTVLWLSLFFCGEIFYKVLLANNVF